MAKVHKRNFYNYSDYKCHTCTIYTAKYIIIRITGFIKLVTKSLLFCKGLESKTATNSAQWFWPQSWINYFKTSNPAIDMSKQRVSNCGVDFHNSWRYQQRNIIVRRPVHGFFHDAGDAGDKWWKVQNWISFDIVSLNICKYSWPCNLRVFPKGDLFLTNLIAFVSFEYTYL